MDSENQQKSTMRSSEGQRSKLVVTGPRTRVKGACIGRKLPRTPDERYDDDGMQVNAFSSTHACSMTSPTGNKDEYEKLNPETMDSYQGSTTTGYEKLNKATMGPQTCSADLEGTNMSMNFDECTPQSAYTMTRSDDKTSGYEKLNPETMDSYQGSATTGYEKLNKATMEPQTCSPDFDDTSITMHPDERASGGACPMNRSDGKD